MSNTQAPETENHQGEAHGNLKLRGRAELTTDPAEQIELAQHPSGLVHAALLSNPNLCDEARAMLSATSENNIPQDEIDTVSNETRKALKI